MALQELYESYVGENTFWMKVAGACMVAAINIAALEGTGPATLVSPPILFFDVITPFAGFISIKPAKSLNSKKPYKKW